MCYLVFSKEPVSYLLMKVTEELAKIDHGFSFSSILNQGHSSDAGKKNEDSEKNIDTLSGN